MAGFVQPYSFLAPLSQEAAIARLTWPIQATIEATPQGLVVQTDNFRIPIDPQTGLKAGQMVLVELVTRPEGARIQITPLNETSLPTPPSQETFQAPSAQAAQQSTADVFQLQTSSPAAPTAGLVAVTPPATTETNQDALTSILRTALEALQVAGVQVNLPTETLEVAIPPAIPTKSEIIQSIFTLLATQTNLGKDLPTVFSLLQEAATAGVIQLPPELELLARTELLLSSSETEFKQRFDRLVQMLTTSSEAKLAQSLREGQTVSTQQILEDNLPAVLEKIRTDPALLRFLESRGQSQNFLYAVDRIIERCTAGQLQNLWSLHDAYLFVELPFSVENAVRSCRIHILSDREGSGRRFDAENSTVIFDLSTTRLGELWIRLARTGKQCSCTFLTTREDAAAAIRAESNSLIESMKQVGFAHVQVRVGLWDGDSLRETVKLLRRFKGLNVKT
ncbi:MAG TPA: flagellar hook-length control protein FliK [Candidatus Hydrogenedentes bacterium]|nr:flagellar hook-length control protein FliK [Candidatus Hydrogenedentota bacterium]HOL76520.1 flagellar hook-length control protein FliK [Candidatus Hydrogenedentota bacterium]HPO85184.1 flagellar hook-length control protein FliK [Candidatus Hydrogenedentota bacterium]